MISRKLSIAGVTAALVLGGGALSACGGGEPTASDMKAWQSEVKSNEAFHDLAAMDEGDLATDCTGAAEKLRSAVEDVEDPPYKGSEWRANTNETLDMVDTACKAIDNGNFTKLMLLEPKITEIEEQEEAWVDDVNKKFPSLNWNADTYFVE